MIDMFFPLFRNFRQSYGYSSEHTNKIRKKQQCACQEHIIDKGLPHTDVLTYFLTVKESEARHTTLACDLYKD